MHMGNTSTYVCIYSMRDNLNQSKVSFLKSKTAMACTTLYWIEEHGVAKHWVTKSELLSQMSWFFMA